MGTALFVRLSVCGSIYIYRCRALLVTGCTCIYAYNLASPTILNFYLNTFSTQIPMKCGRRNMIRVLNYFLECVKLLSVLFHLSIHRPASNASMTTINTVHVLYFQHLRHAYHYMHTCILLNYLILYCVPSTPPT